MKKTPKPVPVHWGFIAAVLMVFVVSISCDIPSASQSSAEQTLAAVQIKETVVAQQATEFAGQNAEATNQAVQVQLTQMSQMATQLAQQPVQTEEPEPEVVVTEAPPPPVQTEEPPPPAKPDVKDKIKAAKILLFEDMSGTGWYRYVQEGLDLGDWTYTDVGSAQGWFKDALLSGTDWDLIIAASESRTKIQGEFFVYLMDYIKKGTAVIIEHWALDDLSQGKVAPILAKCGIGVYRDWFVALGTVPNLSVWFLQPDHPVLHYPNEGISLRRSTNFWNLDTDKGDLLKITSGGDAVLVAGTIADRKSDHGTIAVCMGGRLIFMTQSSHEYYREDITRLWENVAYYALEQHFLFEEGYITVEE